MTILTIAAVWGCVLIVGLAAWMIACHRRDVARRRCVAEVHLTTTDIEWLESQRGGRS